MKCCDRAGQRVDQALRYGGSWPGVGWTPASDGWLERVWARHGAKVAERVAAATSWYAGQQWVPVVVRGVLRVARGVQVAQPGANVLPPTLAGWRQFLDLAPASGLTFVARERAGIYWWDRHLPRTLLSAAREAETS